MRSRKTVTEKQRAANRANGDKSKGPQTKRGKNASKFNAVTLGLFARDIVIPACDGDESEKQFAMLLVDLQREYQPESPFEEFCVVKIAKCMWEFRRVTRAEKSSIQNAASWEGTPPDPLALSEVHLVQSAILKEVLEKVKTTGTFSPEEYAAVVATLPPERRDMAQAELYDHVLASLEEDLRIADKCVDYWFRIAEEMKKDYYAAHALPSEATMNSILRCERRAQKKLDWALQRLLESQRRRRKAQMPS